MTTAQVCILIAIVAYMAMVISVGVRFSKSNETAGDFYLGGRKLGPLVTAMSAEASDMSSWLLMGLPGVAYFCGIADAAWTAIGLAVGTYLNWLLVAKRLRCYSEHINAITIPDFFAKRFHDRSGTLVGISAVVIIIFFIPYTASGFAACGKLFATIFGMDYLTAMIIGAVAIAVYTALGGFLAASTTDFIQSIVMTFALIVVVFFGISVAGGWDNVTAAADMPGYISLTEMTNVMTGETSRYGIITIVSTMAWGLGYFGMPHILLRFMAIRHENMIKLSRRIASVWVVIAMGVAIMIGVIGYAASQTGAIAQFESSSAAEAVIIALANFLSNKGVIAALIAGIILSGILASTMSTADSQLLAASSSVSENLVKNVFGIKLSDKATLIIARVTVVAISVIAAFLARDPGSSVFQIVSFAWAGFGAAFGPVMLTALFWKRTNKWGALAGMVAGGAMVFIWKFQVRPIGGAWNIYELLPAFIVAFLAIIIVSLLTAKPETEIVEEFDAVAAR
ncbi:MAG: sodium/proline symporter [Oscillospiraceae bacterium]